MLLHFDLLSVYFELLNEQIGDDLVDRKGSAHMDIVQAAPIARIALGELAATELFKFAFVHLEYVLLL